ncbi:PAS domain-containing methyl-accepting chemotaxis protein (plasmid) [Chimaeribacter arupi]|uniref:Methyl-accepting chemotaxis protein n=2 Tax=Yersiniaceae TaxID=1903411 RepID=A0A2N5EML9_9GAMM|nr:MULTISPECIES: PAS domain-containing methyl-accepting chemotaxis protein [Yersiniaceae]MBS0968606.1 PAS domain-containing methyl-accepting chemotaxis protein [Nissabacter archeti]PLR33528.1 methyl-accepting chemotaxis protein [Chimaeribacter arupi]PLR49312.1 methyl-accepting chemotaxis protein [Chimaeribacter arupi]WKZ94583.1 PAS domain-containing methyl-accepting chemotaxis protein [Chimaeribacter arupi]
MRLSFLKKFPFLSSLRSAASFNALGQTMPVIEFSPAGIIQKASPLFLATMGYTADEVLGRHHSLFCPPSLVSSPAYRRFWQRLAAGETFSDKYLRLAKGARPVWLEASYIPVTDWRGRVCKIIKIAADISDRMQSVLEQESVITAINRSMAVISFDPAGIVRDVNENFLKTTGYQRDEVLGQHHRMFCSETLRNSAEYRQFWERLNQGEFFSGQFPRLNRRGEPLWLRATYNPVFNNEGQLYKIVKFASDVTEQVLRNQREQEAAVHAWDMAVQTRGSAQAGTEVIENSIRMVEKIMQGMNVVSADITRLNSQSDSIDGMVETIRSFATQTRLIALNAAIEAARAGTSGRSFAVVAAEVRNLAASVSDATEKIERVVASNNQLAKDVLKGIESSLKNTCEGGTLMREAGEVIASIQKNSEGLESAVKDVARSVKAG